MRPVRTIAMLALVCAAPLTLAGCISYTREDTRPPATATGSTVVIPNGTNAVCANGAQPPC